DAAMEQAMLLQQLRPAVDRKRARAARQFGQLRPDMGHEALAADIVADAGRDRREVGIVNRTHKVSPGLWIASDATTARTAPAIRMSACSLGSVRSPPDSQARQKICAGPTT